MIRFFLIGLAFLVMLNLYLGKLIDKRQQFTPQQKRNYKLMLWILPVIWGIIFLNKLEKGK
jgi:hypothetical protein